MIGIKDRSVLKSILIVPFHPILLDVMWWIDESWPDTLILTCGYRQGDLGSVHATVPCRGIDIRSWVYKDPYRVMRTINKYWEYDYTRPKKQVCLLHNTGSGWHMHIQVCDNTRKRKNE